MACSRRPTDPEERDGVGCQQQACWELATLEIEWPTAFESVLISSSARSRIEAEAVKAQKTDNSIDAQTRVVSAGADLWIRVRAWGTNRNLLTEKEQGILDVCSAIPQRIPTDKQCEVALKALTRLHGEGCQLGKDVI